MKNEGNRTRVVVGVLLIAGGVLSLLGQVLGGSGLWPLIVVLFGLMFFVGMVLGGRSLGALAIPGSIITGIGLILWFQNAFGVWETWSYAWALIISLVGIGLVISGLWSGNRELQSKGWETARTGLVLFLAFGIVMEFIFWLTGVSSGQAGLLWPILLMVFGAVQLIWRSVRLMRREEARHRNDLNLFWPVIWIGAGMLWLLTALSLLDLNQLTILINLWPLLLVAAGVNLLFGRRLQWVNFLLGAVVVAGMFYVVFNGTQLGLASRSPWLVWGINTENSAPVTEWVTGSGVLTREERPAGEFSRVRLNLAGEVDILQGSQTGLVIEGEDNLLPFIVSEVRGGELIIETKPGVGFRSTKALHFILTVSDLEALNVSGAAKVRLKAIQTPELTIQVNGTGSFDLQDLQADRLSIDINGSGTVNAEGQAAQLNVTINGAGSFKGGDLQSEICRVSISGLGSATVWATQSLNTSIGGAGGISYYGNPEVKESTGGIGAVRKLGDK